MRNPEVVVDVQDGRLQVTERRRIDLIRHVYEPSSDRELLRRVSERVSEVERAGA